MADTIKMRALMSLPAQGVRRDEVFEASAQAARDLVQAGRAEIEPAPRGGKRAAKEPEPGA